MANKRINTKICRWLITILVIAIFTAISWWIVASSRQSVVNMDELGRDNLYHYRNEDLDFNLDLPEQFIYYQTERTDFADYREIRFYVPTSDPDYVHEAVSSYAQPITVRAYNEQVWNDLDDSDESKSDFQKITAKDGQVYLIWFWDRQPNDWQDKWNDEMREAISQSLR